MSSIISICLSGGKNSLGQINDEALLSTLQKHVSFNEKKDQGLLFTSSRLTFGWQNKFDSLVLASTTTGNANRTNC